MNAETLKRIIDKIPDDYGIYYQHLDDKIPLRDLIEIDVKHKKLILK